MARRVARERQGERHQHPAYPQLYVLKQPASRFYYAEWCIEGRKKRQSLKTVRLTTAFTLAAERFPYAEPHCPGDRH